MKIKDFYKKNKKWILMIVFLLSFCLFLGLLSFLEHDYFWHIKAGEYMTKNATILTKDIFSWSLYGKQWMSHEWLFEIILYKMSNIFPNIHIFIYTFMCQFILFLIVFLGNKKKILKNIIFTIIWIVFSIVLCGLLSFRPHMLSNIFLAFSVLIYRDLFYNEDSKKIYFLPIISLLWVNIHGGSSSLIYLIGLVFLACGLFKFKFSKIEATRLSKRQIYKYLIGITISFLVLFINPAGWKMITYPYVNMGDSFMLEFISEWHQTNFNDFFHYFYLLLLIGILLVFIFSKKKIRLIDFVLFGLGTFLGLKSIRFWAYVYIFSSFFIFDYIGESKAKINESVLLISLSVLFSLMVIVNSDMIVKNIDIVSDDIIKVLKKEAPKRLYNYYDYGGYLIYNDIDVFVDGRADLYSDGTLVKYNKICNLSAGFKELIDKYNFDYFLVPKDISIEYYLNGSDNYEKIISDNNIILYKKRA